MGVMMDVFQSASPLMRKRLIDTFDSLQGTHLQHIFDKFEQSGYIENLSIYRQMNTVYLACLADDHIVLEEELKTVKGLGDIQVVI